MKVISVNHQSDLSPRLVHRAMSVGCLIGFLAAGLVLTACTAASGDRAGGDPACVAFSEFVTQLNSGSLGDEAIQAEVGKFWMRGSTSDDERFREAALDLFEGVRSRDLERFDRARAAMAEVCSLRAS